MFNHFDLLEEDVNPDEIDVSSVRFHSELNPIIWKKYHGEYLLCPEFREKLLEISEKFSEYIRYNGSKFTVEDIILTGSNCNFNYTPTSDLDVHLIVDYDSISEDTELVSQYLYDKKILWSMKNDIKIKNVPIECYAADSSEDYVKGASYYSLLKSEWIVKPDVKNVNVDMSAVREKASDLMNMIELASTEDELEHVQNKIWRMRSSGLHRKGEFSIENIAYKILRSTGVLEDIKTKLQGLSAS